MLQVNTGEQADGVTAPHVYRAICAVTAIMAKEGISKGRQNVQQGYKFRGIDDVYAALSVHLAANGLCMLPRVVERTAMERPTKTGGVSTYTILTVEFDFVSAVDGSRHTIRTVGEAMDTADKSSNKSMSAAMKYACLMSFQIPTEGDNDADAHHPEPAPRRAPPAPTSSPGPSASVAEFDATVDTYIAAIEAATETKELMAIYATLQSDGRLLEAAKGYVVQCCSAKRRRIESKGKAA